MNGFHLLSCNKVDALESQFEDLKAFAGEVAGYFGEHQDLEWEELFKIFKAFFEVIDRAKERNVVLEKKREKERKKEEDDRKRKERMKLKKEKSMNTSMRWRSAFNVETEQKEPSMEPLHLMEAIRKRGTFYGRDLEEDSEDGEGWDDTVLSP